MGFFYQRKKHRGFPHHLATFSPARCGHRLPSSLVMKVTDAAVEAPRQMFCPGMGWDRIFNGQ